MVFIRERHQFSKDIRDQLSSLRALDNWHGLIAVFYDYAVIAFAAMLFYFQPWCYPISLLLIGSRQRALATLLHEATHRCLAKSPFLNRLLGTYCSGYLILQEFNTYLDSHVKRHHAYLGDKANDPDYSYHLNLKLYEYHGCIDFFKNYILKPILLVKIISYLLYLVEHRIMPRKPYLKNFMAMFLYWLVIIAICLYFKVGIYLLLLWFVPLITTSAIVGWFNELAEHYPLVGRYQDDLHMTRNRFSHWLEHFIFNTHAENYHLVHHMQPTIPFWNLKKAHHILYKDPEYAKWNNTMGGIFVSNNKNPSLIRLLLLEPIIKKDGSIHYELK